MNIREWSERNSPLEWSIYDKDSYQAAEDYERERGFDVDRYEQIELDFSAPKNIPDGVFTITCYPYEYKVFGLEVKNGQFDPDNADEIIYQATALNDGVLDEELGYKPQIHHRFVEAFRWYKDTAIIEVVMGS